MLRRFLEHKVVHVVLILVVFSLTGSSAMRISNFFTDWIGWERSSLVRWVFMLVAIFPIYNVLLLGFAFIFGKYDWFRAKQLKTWAKIKRLFAGFLSLILNPRTKTLIHLYNENYPYPQ